MVDGDVGVLETVDGVGRAGKAAEMKITADVVILVKLGEDRFDLSAIEAEIGDGHGTSVAARDGQIFIHDLAQGHKTHSASFLGTLRAEESLFLFAFTREGFLAPLGMTSELTFSAAAKAD